MTDSESELERMIAAARGIPAPPRATEAELGQRLMALTVWLRFWHERRGQGEPAGDARRRPLATPETL